MPNAHHNEALAARKNMLIGLALAAAGSIAFSGKAIIVKLAYRHGVDAVSYTHLDVYKRQFVKLLGLQFPVWPTFITG